MTNTVSSFLPSNFYDYLPQYDLAPCNFKFDVASMGVSVILSSKALYSGFVAAHSLSSLVRAEDITRNPHSSILKGFVKTIAYTFATTILKQIPAWMGSAVCDQRGVDSVFSINEKDANAIRTDAAAFAVREVYSFSSEVITRTMMPDLESFKSSSDALQKSFDNYIETNPIPDFPISEMEGFNLKYVVGIYEQIKASLISRDKEIYQIGQRLVAALKEGFEKLSATDLTEISYEQLIKKRDGQTEVTKHLNELVLDSGNQLGEVFDKSQFLVEGVSPDDIDAGLGGEELGILEQSVRRLIAGNFEDDARQVRRLRRGSAALRDYIWNYFKVIEKTENAKALTEESMIAQQAYLNGVMPKALKSLGAVLSIYSAYATALGSFIHQGERNKLYKARIAAGKV